MLSTDKLLNVLEKKNSPPSTIPPTKKFVLAIVVEISASVEPHLEKKKLASVMTTLIGYELAFMFREVLQ